MVRPYAAFAALEQRCAAADDGDESVFDTLDEPSFADLLTWYHLAWCGASLKRSEPLVQRLMAQGRGFTFADRAALYDLVGHVVSGILPRYRRLAERGQVELSVTPHGHPIGPLLIDFRVAADGGEQEATLPRAERYPGGTERARWHVEQAQRIFGRAFGRPPAGLWPAEAAVSAEFLHLLGGMGLDWAAMDGVSLQRSLGHEGGAVPPASWRLEGSAGPRLFVRDTPLSEFLSFEYSRRAPADAVRHLLDGVAERLSSPRRPARRWSA